MPVLDHILDRPAAPPTRTGGLTEEQQAQFDRDGYVVLRGLFSPDEIARIRESFMTLAADGPVPGLSDIPQGEHAFDKSDPLAFYPRIMNPHHHPEFEVCQVAHDFLLNAHLYPVLEELFGDEPVGVQTMFYFKPAGARGQELHQDNFYLRVKPGTCMAAWLAVDDVDAGNGGMKVVPGSHHGEIVCPQEADRAISFTNEQVPVPQGMEAVQCDMKAGDVLFFNGSLIHGSTPNTSRDRFRRSLIAHYVPRNSEETASWYKPFTFSGEHIEIAAATGGGPCGTPHAAMGPH